MNQSVIWQQLDHIADAYNPLLLLTALLLIVRFFIGHKIHEGYKLLALLSLGLLSVYALMWIDERYRLWSLLSLDYSTHTAFALCMVWIIHRAIAKQYRLQILLWVSLIGYIVLMDYQDYHSISDILSTAFVFTCIMMLVDFIFINRSATKDGAYISEHCQGAVGSNQNQTGENIPDSVLRLSDIDHSRLTRLLARYQLELTIVDNEKIPGSFWGDDEAGLIGTKLYARMDTPIHSILHESGHYICMDSDRRTNLHTNAEGDYDEENAVCYLQILLADEIPEMGRSRMLNDMDAWGYSFRLGSAKAWFEQDADDAYNWLLKNKLVTHQQPNYKLRRSPKQQ